MSGGNVYVTDFIRNDVQKFDADGAYVLTFGGFGSNPGQFNEIGWGALDAKGAFWAPDSGNDRIQQFSPDGAFLQAIGPDLGTPTPTALVLDGPQGVALDAAGRIFIADTENARVVVLAATGTVLATVGEDTLEYPVALAVTDDGVLVALDYGRRGALQAFRLALPDSAPP
ncbi:MAG: NHL repeat-containing protein [Thermomicrobiales bacterium]|nr:NHL repeat-containing protein [Thermomicrobiales bacterium]